MPSSFKFETPENVELHYEPAGAGTRFLAWMLDQFVLWLAMLALLVVALLAGVSFDSALGGDGRGSADRDRAIYYFVGLTTLIWGLGSFVYFTASELILRGQTIGKRASRIRVVKADGFQLDAASVLARNLFRVLDNLPLMWIVPVMSRRCQRTGDMVAGTLVISEAKSELSSVRTALAERTAVESQFRFDLSKLNRLSGADFQAVEQILDRLVGLSHEEQNELLSLLTARLATKLGTDVPPADQRLRYLEDLLGAEFRRRDRALA
jgi:uncharacterized RDD family membrane protein YckC